MMCVMKYIQIYMKSLYVKEIMFMNYLLICVNLSKISYY